MDKCITCGMKSIFVTLILLLSINSSSAQTTAFTYQGKLTNVGSPASGNYDLQFKLFDALVNGAQIGSPVTTTLTIANGNFTLPLDFGAAAFNGAARYLEIGVRSAGSPDPFTLLSPRQALLSTPYAMRSLSSATSDNATQLGGIDSTRYVQQDAGGNVSIAGGLAVAGSLSLNIVNAQTQYNLGGNRILSTAGTSNLFAGNGAGAANTTGDRNSFFGSNAGQGNTTGAGNSFFGESAGLVNSQGSFNVFVGESAGRSNTTGNQNAFFGNSAGRNTTTGFNNAFLGTNAGFNNTTGNNNSFVGRNAGLNNIASNNAFFGTSAGQANTTGNENSFFGDGAGAGNVTGSFNTFVGRQAGLNNLGDGNSFFGHFAGQANTTGTNNAFFGESAGLANITGSRNAFFGYRAGSFNTATNNAFFGIDTGRFNSIGTFNAFFGTSAGNGNTTGSNNSFFGFGTGFVNTTGFNNTFLGSSAGNGNTTGSNHTIIGAGANVGADNLTNANALGANAFVAQSNSLVLGSINGINSATADTNIGIGTTAPQTRLQVKTLSNNYGFTHTDGTVNVGSYVSPTGGWLGTVSNHPLHFFINGGLPRMTVDTTGNVGIGTTAPGAKLSVAGLLESTTGGVKFPDGSIQTTAATPSASVILNQATPQAGANFNIAGNGTVGGTLTANSSQVTGNGFVLGNFGIGTAAPKAKLEVTGGNILIDSPGLGFILKSPDGNTCRLLSVDNAGAVTLTAIACP